MDPITAFNNLQMFLERGGPVLNWIMALTFIMWAFILERLAYFSFAHKGVRNRVLREWGARAEHTSWQALAIRDQLISEVKQKADQNVELIKTLVGGSPVRPAGHGDRHGVGVRRHGDPGLLGRPCDVVGRGPGHNPDHGRHGRRAVGPYVLESDRAHGQAASARARRRT